MAARVITIAQQKGGAGKTTVAVQLSLAWAAAGKRVAIIDIDPQGSLIRWFSLRETAAERSRQLTVSAVAGWRLSGEIDRLARDHDLVVVDSPPHAQTEARAAIRAAHLVVVPVQPSPLDVWATKPTLDLAAEERVAAILVLNRVPVRGLTTEASISALTALGVAMAKTRLGNRGSFAVSMAEGRGVGETAPGTIAAREISKLAREIGDYANTITKRR